MESLELGTNYTTHECGCVDEFYVGVLSKYSYSNSGELLLSISHTTTLLDGTEVTVGEARTCSECERHSPSLSPADQSAHEAAYFKAWDQSD